MTEKIMTGQDFDKIESEAKKTAEMFMDVSEIKTFIQNSNKKYKEGGLSYEGNVALGVMVAKTLIEVTMQVDHPKRYEKYESFKKMMGSLDPETKAFLRWSVFKDDAKSFEHLHPIKYSGTLLLRSQLLALVV